MFEADTSELVVRTLRPRDARALQEAHTNLLPLEYERSFYLGVCGDEEGTDCCRNGDQVVFALGALESRRCEQKLVGFVTARVETYGSKAEDEGIILPFAWEHWLWERRRIVYILTLGVEKRFRRRGVASRLVRSVLRIAKESYGCMLAYLHAIEYNEEAARFYGSVGFTRVGCVKNFYDVRSGMTPFPGRTEFDAFLFVRFLQEEKEEEQGQRLSKTDTRSSCGTLPWDHWSWLRGLFARAR